MGNGHKVLYMNDINDSDRPKKEILQEAEEASVIATPKKLDSGEPPTFEIANLRKFFAQENSTAGTNADLVESINIETGAQPSLGNQTIGGKNTTKKAKAFLSGVVNKVNRHFLIDSVKKTTSFQEPNNAVLPSAAKRPEERKAVEQAGQQMRQQRRTERQEMVHNLITTSTAATLDSMNVAKQTIGAMNQRRSNTSNAPNTPRQQNDPSSAQRQQNDTASPPQTTPEPPLTNVPQGSELTPNAPRNTSGGSGGNAQGAPSGRRGGSRRNNSTTRPA